MLKFVKECDLMKTEVSFDDLSEFREKIEKIDTESSARSLGKKGYKSLISATIGKICVEDFPPYDSDGNDLAMLVFDYVMTISKKLFEMNFMSEQEVYDELLEFFIALLKAGPGSAHGEFLKQITRFNKFEKYLQKLDHEKLSRVIEALKAFKHNPGKGIKKEKHHRSIYNNYPVIMDTVFCGREDKETPKVIKMVVDLNNFYQQLLLKMPAYKDTISDCLFKINHLYSEDLLKSLPDTDTYQDSLATAQKTISQPDFPQSEDFEKEIAKTVKNLIEAVEGERVAEIYGDMLEFVKAIHLNPHAEKYKLVLNELKRIKRLPKKKIEGSPKYFETWASVAVKTLPAAPRLIKIGDLWAETGKEFVRNTKQKKEYDKLWLSVIKAFLTWPIFKEPMVTVNLIVTEDRWKRVLNWKDNAGHAKKILQMLIKADYDTVKGMKDEEIDTRYEREALQCVGKTVKAIREQLDIAKVEKTVEVEAAELAVMPLEKFPNSQHMLEIFYYTCDDIVLKVLQRQNNKELIAGYLDRLYHLMELEDYPWDQGWAAGAIESVLLSLMESFKKDEETTPEVDQMYNKIFLYAMAEDREKISLEKGDLNIFGKISTTILYQWVHLHIDRMTVKKLEPLFPSIQRLMSSDEDEIQSSMQDIMSSIGTSATELLTSDSSTQTALDLYIKNPSSELFGTLEAAYENSPDQVAARFDELMEAFCTDKPSYVLQGLLLKKIAETQPQMFTKPGIIKMIFENHYMDSNANSFILQFLDELSKNHSELLEPYVESHLLKPELMLESMASYHGNIMTRIAAKCKKKQQSVYNFFAKRMKSSNEWIVHAAVQGLREILTMSGPELFTKEDRKFIEGLQNKAPTMYIKDAAEDLTNALAGRSLEKVSKDVDGHTGDIKKLNVGLAGTKVVVKRVQKDVKKQEKEIKQVKKDVQEVNERVDQVEEDLEETKEKVEEIDKKTMSNAPTWSRDVTKLLNPESDHDWRLLASRLGYSPDDIRGWATQSDPCMALLSEWYATHKTFEASRGVLNVLQEMNRLDAAVIVENAMKVAEGVVADEPVDYPEPPEIFLSYQWGHQNEVKLINRHLEMAGYKCWMDVGQMGGGDKLFEKIDTGIRAAKIIISCVTEKYAKSPNCNREVNLSVNLGKPMIPLLMEKMAWPPPGSMGPIFSEYLFIRFFQRPGEETKDDRFWPAPKFVELLMQLNCLKVMPDEKSVNKLYKNWWLPVVEEIVIPKKKNQKASTDSKPQQQETKKDGASPEVFISYQWGKQKEISALYQKLTGLGLTCWMDIHQMGGGDSLYDKIDRGIRGCKVVVSSVTTKYSLSANCRREVSLADALKKPLIPMLMEKIDWPPSGPMSMVLTQLLYINFSKDESIQKTWEGKQFDELLSKIEEHVPLHIERSIKSVNGNSQETDKSRKIASSKSAGDSTVSKTSSNQKPAVARPVSSKSTKSSALIKTSSKKQESASNGKKQQVMKETENKSAVSGSKSSEKSEMIKSENAKQNSHNKGEKEKDATPNKSHDTKPDVSTNQKTDVSTNQNVEENKPKEMPKSEHSSNNQMNSGNQNSEQPVSENKSSACTLL